MAMRSLHEAYSGSTKDVTVGAGHCDRCQVLACLAWHHRGWLPVGSHPVQMLVWTLNINTSRCYGSRQRADGQTSGSRLRAAACL